MQLSFAYDADGIRTSKTVENVVHEYVTQSGKVVRETIGTGTTAEVLDFIYDESGRPFALKYSTDGGSTFTTYYYVLNLQGDVVKLVEHTRSGKVYTLTTVASYTYNAWGEILTSSGTMSEINPLRYRGYYYNTETGFYYLQSRYYDPAMHRFINADSLASTGQGILGTNMFAYCNNNPINNQDPTGEFLITTLILIGAAVIGTATAVYTGYEARKAGCDWADTIFYSVGSGLCAFGSVYTLGMTAYGTYCNICIINGKTPVTEIGSSASNSTTLYRAVSPAEYQSTVSTQQFSSPSNGSNASYEDSKFFATTFNDAARWGNAMYRGTPFEILQATVNNSVFTNSSTIYYEKLDGIGAAYCISVDVLNKATHMIK